MSGSSFFDLELSRFSELIREKLNVAVTLGLFDLIMEAIEEYQFAFRYFHNLILRG